MKRFSAILIILALVAGMIGCQPVPAVQYELTISSTEGGSVTAPGEGTFTYDEGAIVSLEALPDSGYFFAGWTGDVGTIGNNRAASTTISMNGDYSITASFASLLPAQCSLAISSTTGGAVTTPGQGAFTYDRGAVVSLVAEAEEGYVFVGWTGDVTSVADVNAASTSITVDGSCSITANFAIGIYDWHDLDAIRDNLSGHYVLMNDLGSATVGYEQLAGPTANGGKGWEPIGGLSDDQFRIDVSDPVDPFAGSLNGQRYEIKDLFIYRPEDDGVGLLGFIGRGAVVQDIGLVNAAVTGRVYVGGLVGGSRWGIVRDSYSSGTVTGEGNVGGVIGHHGGGSTLTGSYATGSVMGNWMVGGLVGWQHYGTTRNSYYLGTVAGEGDVGGVVGANWHGTVSNSYYNHDEVLINGQHLITIGALFGEDFEQWLANGKFLDVNEKLSKEDGYYSIRDVSDFKKLLAFGQDGSLRFRLRNDLDFGYEPNLYIPHLAAEFDGNGHRISNLSLNPDLVSQIGLFGHLADGGRVTRLGVENANITTKGCHVGILVGFNNGIVNDCYSIGRVNGGSSVGGLIGTILNGTVRNSYFGGSVAGESNVGGLAGFHFHGVVLNSYYNYDEVLINGEKLITVGALFGEDFEQWLGNDRFLDVNQKLSREDGYYLIDDLDDFRQLLAFGQYGSLRFRLTNDLDLGSKPDFYIPHLAGEFDGNGHRISNLSFSFDSSTQVGLFGYLARGGTVTRVGVENANVTGGGGVGGLVGHSYGTVSNSYASGSISGRSQVGGVVGQNRGKINNCYSSGSIIGGSLVGGLVGDNFFGTIRNSYSTGRVTGDEYVGGLVGQSVRGTVSLCFWDMEASKTDTSDGGTGRTTAEMIDITTFGRWDIVAVVSGESDSTYTWNIIDGQTYPFLSWQPVS